MRRKSIEIITLITAIIGAVTGVAALGWQVFDNLSAKTEDLKLLFVAHVTDDAVIVPTLYITNLSRDDVYLEEVQIGLRPPPSAGVWLKNGVYVAPGDHILCWTGDSIKASPEPLINPLKPKQKRVLELKRVHYESEKGFRDDFVEQATKVVLKTTTGRVFELPIREWERSNTRSEVMLKLSPPKKPNKAPEPTP